MGSLLLYTDAGFARHRGTGPWHGDRVCSEPSSSFCREGITTRFGSSSLRALDGLTGGQEGGLHPQVRRPGMDQSWARKATSTWSRARSCRRRPCRGVTPILASAQITQGEGASPGRRHRSTRSQPTADRCVARPGSPMGPRHSGGLHVPLGVCRNRL